MYCNTGYGDYPSALPDGPADARGGLFAGWMLLSAFAPAAASSTLGALSPNFAVDESMRTWWSARTSDAGEWLRIDLGEVAEIRAIQVNFADQDAQVLGRAPGLRHRYRIEASITEAPGNPGPAGAADWFEVVDASQSQRDAPHAYHELPAPAHARQLRITNVEMPTGGSPSWDYGCSVSARGTPHSPWRTSPCCERTPRAPLIHSPTTWVTRLISTPRRILRWARRSQAGNLTGGAHG
jgi:hypothetical protein